MNTPDRKPSLPLVAKTSLEGGVCLIFLMLTGRTTVYFSKPDPLPSALRASFSLSFLKWKQNRQSRPHKDLFPLDK